LTLGSQKTLDTVDREFCLDYYKQILTPRGAIVSIVGNFDQNTILATIQKVFGSWSGKEVADVSYPVIPAITSETIDIKKNRDQVVLAFAGLSVSRLDPMYDHLLLYDQILSGGMSSRLFELREQSGLFYTIGGSLVHGAGRQPGMVFFKTIVSNDRLEEAERAIVNCFNTEIDTVTDQEFLEAQEVVVNAYPALYESNESIAATFLFLQKYGLPFDYFEHQIDHMRNIKKETMQQSVKKILNSDALVTIRIGRL
jgi:zinc protease